MTSSIYINGSICLWVCLAFVTTSVGFYTKGMKDRFTNWIENEHSITNDRAEKYRYREEWRIGKWIIATKILIALTVFPLTALGSFFLMAAILYEYATLNNSMLLGLVFAALATAIYISRWARMLRG